MEKAINTIKVQRFVQTITKRRRRFKQYNRYLFVESKSQTQAVWKTQNIAYINLLASKYKPTTNYYTLTSKTENWLVSTVTFVKLQQ